MILKLNHALGQLMIPQLMSEPTHILQQSSRCIDLIFAKQPNIAMDSVLD